MRYLWVLILAAIALAQQSGDNKKVIEESDKKAEEPAPLFKKKLGYKSSRGDQGICDIELQRN